MAEGWIGRRLGPYRLVASIGSGGMGAVYFAERDDGWSTKTYDCNSMAIATACRIASPAAVSGLRDLILAEVASFTGSLPPATTRRS